MTKSWLKSPKNTRGKKKSTSLNIYSSNKERWREERLVMFQTNTIFRDTAIFYRRFTMWLPKFNGKSVRYSTVLQHHSFHQIYRDNTEDTKSKAVPRAFVLRRCTATESCLLFWWWLALCVCIHMRAYGSWMRDSCVWLSFITLPFHSYYSI